MSVAGRVEGGPGSLGPLAIAPFPIPAHQTGRADLRHPAFRLASPRGTRRGHSGQALEAQNAEFSMNYIECKSAIDPYVLKTRDLAPMLP
jgi:hypothetical protein